MSAIPLRIFSLENPFTSMMWLDGDLYTMWAVQLYAFIFRQFGSTVEKATGFISNLPQLELLPRIHMPAHGPIARLQGKAMYQGEYVWKTKLAEAYPRNLPTPSHCLQLMPQRVRRNH